MKTWPVGHLSVICLPLNPFIQGTCTKISLNFFTCSYFPFMISIISLISSKSSMPPSLLLIFCFKTVILYSWDGIILDFKYDSSIFEQTITEDVHNMHAKTHTQYTMEVQGASEIKKSQIFTYFFFKFWYLCRL